MKELVSEIEKKIILRRNIKDVFFIIIGVCMASIGLKGFLLPNHFLDGGAMGLSLLFQILTPINLSLLILLVNAPFVLMGYKQISPQFAIKSTLAIVALASLVHIIEIPPFTADKLLIAVFGGFFLGSGIGFSIRGGAVIDGTEVLALSVSRKSSLTVGDFIALFNIVLFAFAALVVSLETAMYSMLTYLAASKTVDFIINGIEEYIGVMIISDQAESVKSMIADDLGRGVTAFLSDGGYGKKGNTLPDRKILFCAITRLEVSKVLLEVEKIDPSAFVIQYPIKDTKGGMIKKRPLH
ncbi:YitT family protein [Reichenbachiella carrageenanivorans]|uniref:YitT family protein n=1 Tax=Reichenbachiella carrageenanivorans TaxID=2979869 RepID=A0ABY6D7U6_9BACT|nr:YitT family protein [Reichenbachiella carrageenanivorans]UXX81228.1 YitT family protein [Reichenbachiella carrageenanivorans]